MSKILDRTGIRYGKLIALEIDEEKTKSVPKEKRQGTFWKCKCDCGNIVTVRGNILGKNTKSCGCVKKEQDKENLGRFTHGKSHSRLASIWYHMVGRCHKENDDNYKNYGAKGVKVCEEWRNDFLEFEKWSLNNGYSDDLSIDRINVNQDYTPSNCRWVGFDVQSNNKRGTLWIKFNGELMSLKQAYNLAQPEITYQTVKSRYHKGIRNTEELFKKNRQYRGK